MLFRSQDDGFAFLRYDENYNSNSCDIIVFFLQDKLEMLDSVKLYDSSIPVVFGTPLISEPTVDDVPHDANIHYLDLNRHKGEISEDMQKLFSGHFRP